MLFVTISVFIIGHDGLIGSQLEPFVSGRFMLHIEWLMDGPEWIQYSNGSQGRMEVPSTSLNEIVSCSTNVVIFVCKVLLISVSCKLR